MNTAKDSNREMLRYYLTGNDLLVSLITENISVKKAPARCCDFLG